MLNQIISFTYPHIGNVGINEEDFESERIYSKGIIIHDLPFQHSNFRSHCSLSEFLIKKNIVGIAGIDTRSLTRHLREHGAQSGCIFADKDIDETHALKFAQEFSGLLGLDLAQKFLQKLPIFLMRGEWSLGKGFEKKINKGLNVIAYDFGIKKNILRMLVSRGCNVTVVPAKNNLR